MTSKPDAVGSLVEWFNEYIGDPETEAADLKRISPVYNAAALKIPLLLAHGTDDDRVDIEHLYRISFALDRLNVPYEKIVMDGIGHDFENSGEAVEFYSRLYAFLRKHLGK
jgi:dipeptidyl aminopeptidase/acylaminoacyl peptidase